MSTRRKRRHEVIESVLRGDADGLAAVIARKTDVINVRDGDARTALHHAAINGDIRIVEKLVGAGADVQVADASGWTPLHFAAHGYHVAVAGILLDAGAQVDAEDLNGNTPLFRATFESRGRGDMIRLLIHRGADVAHVNKHGISPSDLAATIANYAVAKWFDASPDRNT